MSALTTMTCDRCRLPFKGFVVDSFTAGFYARGPSGTGWEKWMSSEEKIVCDLCMQTDPRYVAVYGPLPNRDED